MDDKKSGVAETSGLGEKLLGVGAVLAGAFLFFRVVVVGIFKLMMGGNSENGVYVLFYGGGVVLIILVGIGVTAGLALWRGRKGNADNVPSAPPESAFRRGVRIGLVLVTAIVLLLVSLFAWLILVFRH
jgi:hypothetical protein